MAKKSREIRCSVCGKGTLRQRLVTHDVGDLLGLKQVVVKNALVWVCPKCGEVTVDGAMLEQVSFAIAASIISQSVLEPIEVRYLRKLLGDRQQDLADKLGVNRATVNRWEMGSDPVTVPGRVGGLDGPPPGVAFGEGFRAGLVSRVNRPRS